LPKGLRARGQNGRVKQAGILSVTVSCCQPVIGRGIPVSYRLFVPENGAVIALVGPAMIAGQAVCPGQVTRFPSFDKVRLREKRPRQGETGDFRGFEQSLRPPPRTQWGRILDLLIFESKAVSNINGKISKSKIRTFHLYFQEVATDSGRFSVR